LTELLAPTGSLLDVGAGTGRLSLPVAAAGHRVTAVEPSAAMATELEQAAAEAGVAITTVNGRWPGAAATVGGHDVVLSANVVYDVGPIGPFLEALAARAQRAVVLELTQRHPWDGLRGYFRELHEVSLPEGPTVADLLDVIDEIFAMEPQRRDWPSSPALPFETRDALLDMYATRLCVRDERRSELEDVIGPDIDRTPDGSYVLRTVTAGMSTLWWDTD
jgi:SAM-dependent methyltransferase